MRRSAKPRFEKPKPSFAALPGAYFIAQLLLVGTSNFKKQKRKIARNPSKGVKGKRAYGTDDLFDCPAR